MTVAKVSRWVDRIPLRWVLVGLATLPSLLTGGLVGTLAFRNQQKAVDELAQSIFNETSTHIDEHLHWLTSIPPTVTLDSRNALNIGQLDASDLPAWSYYLLLNAQNHSELKFLFFGTASNRYVELALLPDSAGFSFRLKLDPDDPELLDYSLDSDGNPDELIDVRTFNPVTRPWYRQAVAANRPTWTSIYEFAAPTPELGISFVRPYFDLDGQLLGVFGADFTLASIQQFLTQLSVTESSEVLLMERSGNLIASSLDELSVTQNGDRIHLDDVTHPLVQATATAIRSQELSLSQLATADQLQLRENGQHLRARIVPFTDEFGLDWLIVVVIPNSDLVGGIPADVAATAIACIALTLATAAIGAYVARRIQRPLRDITQVAEDFTQRQVLRAVPITGPPETQTIANSHNRMTRKLQELLEDLEGKVEERTRQLDAHLRELQETRDRLQESETQLLEAQRVARMGNWVHTLSTDDVRWSQEMVRLMGFDPLQEPPPLETFVAALVEGDMDRYVDRVRKTIATGEPFELEVRVQLEDGSLRHLNVRGEVSIDEAGNPLELFGTALDITELKEAEAALQEKEERWQLALKGNNDGIWDWNVESGVTYQSDRLETMLGYDPAGIPDSHDDWHSRLHPDDKDEVLHTLQQHLDGNTPFYTAEYRLRCKDGSYKWILDRGQALWDATGKPVRMVGSHTDIDRRKQTERALAKSEERFRTLVSNIPGAVYRCAYDRDWTMQYLSGAAEELSGYPSSDFLERGQRTWNDLIHVDDRPLVRQAIDAAVENQEPFAIEYRITHADGDIRWLYEKGQAIFADSGDVMFLDGAIFDITPLKQVEAELAVAKQEADAANRAKSQFLANMSHELRTPLNGILGYVQLLQQTPNLSSANASYLEVIDRSGEHLLELINNVLDMAKIEAGRMGLEPTAFDVYSLLHTLERLVQLRASDKGLSLSFTRSPDVPQYIRTDAGKLRQILLNLLGNAVKFTQTGGIVLRTRCEEVAAIAPQNSMMLNGLETERDIATSDSELGEQDTKGVESDRIRLYFDVEDTGPGIAAEDMDSLFEVFVQTKVGKQLGEGTGLGLPISRQFARMMGGDITAASRIDRGAVFQVEIVASRASAADVPQTAPRQVISLSDGQPAYKILVVDDQLDNRRLLATALQQIGFSVRMANTGKQAVREWMQWQPEFIWMDLRMDGMDGYEATRRIRRLEQEHLTGEHTDNRHTNNRHTAIVALTASAMPEERDAALQAGCDNCMRKPYKLESIYDALARYLGATYDYRQDPTQAQTTEDYSQEDLLGMVQQMPADWLRKLHAAALCLDEEGVVSQLDDLDSNQMPLEHSLSYWARTARFDRILTLMQKVDCS